MSIAWKNYQEEAASFFRSLGVNAKVEEIVEGVRGKHKIDVWVTGELHGITFRWIVECKCWKNNVPKEKVMALLSIIQDVGADRGFLLSEVGFQSGAIRAARNANLTLTSIADLRDEAKESLKEWEAAKLHWRFSRIKARLWQLHKQTDEYFSEYSRLMGQIAFLDLAFDDASRGCFPTVYAIIDDDKRLKASHWEDFLSKATELLDNVEASMERIQSLCE